jgi:hypothetical protein
VLALASCAFAAQAHIVYGTKTLRGLVAEADLVLQVRIVATGEPVSVTTEAGNASRPTVDAKILGVLKGSYGEERVRFAQHGHGVVEFEPGKENLLFLIDIERSRELGALARTGALAWVSLQEHGDAYPVVPATRGPLLRAVRAYVASEGGENPKAREAALRRASRELITSGDPHLAASAIGDLVRDPNTALATSEDLPALLAVIEDPDTSMGVRAALVTELTRRQLVDPLPLWQRLLSDGTPDQDLITAIRAAGASVGPSVDPRLVELLQGPNSHVAAAAAAALGRPGNTEAIAPLTAAIAAYPHIEGRRVRNAAIRGLGRIGAPAAFAALQAAADSHPDPWTRTRAGRELRLTRDAQARN